MALAASTSDDDMSPDRRERHFLLLLIAILAFSAWLIVRPYLGWILFALFLGYLVFPLRHALVTRRVPRWLAAGLATLATTALIIAPFGIIAWQLSDDLTRLSDAFEDKDPAEFLASFAEAAGLPDAVRAQVFDIVRGASGAIAARAVEWVDDVVIGSILSVFLLYATLADGDRLVVWLRKNVPLSEGRKETLFAQTKKGLDAIVFGVIAVAIIQGLTAAVGWWLFGLPEPLFWGFVLVAASLVPYMGVYIVLGPAIVWLFLTASVTEAVLFTLFAMFVVGLVDNVARPILIGRRGGIHPAVVLVGVVGGIPAFGAMGIVVGPLILALFLAVLEVFRRPERAEQKGLELREQNGTDT